MSLGSIVVGVLSAGAAALAATSQTFSSSEMQSASLAVAACLGFLVGASMCSVVMTVIDSAVCTVFVCFAEDPGSLRSTHPDAHLDLMRGWCARYPQEMVSCGYMAASEC